MAASTLGLQGAIVGRTTNKGSGPGVAGWLIVQCRGFAGGRAPKTNRRGTPPPFRDLAGSSPPGAGRQSTAKRDPLTARDCVPTEDAVLAHHRRRAPWVRANASTRGGRSPKARGPAGATQRTHPAPAAFHPPPPRSSSWCRGGFFRCLSSPIHCFPLHSSPFVAELSGLGRHGVLHQQADSSVASRGDRCLSHPTAALPGAFLARGGYVKRMSAGCGQCPVGFAVDEPRTCRRKMAGQGGDN